MTIPYYSENEKKEARKIDLLSYLQEYEPRELVRSGPNEYRTASHHSLIISNGKWNWVNGEIGGASALDYLIKVRGLDFMEAMSVLRGRPAPHVFVQPVNSDKPKAPFKLPEAARFPSHTIAYLQSRGIAPEIIRHCLGRNMYESRLYNNCVFVGHDKAGKARFACLRGTKDDYKQDVTSSEKRFGFALSGSGDTLLVCESPIDALSRAAIDKLDGLPWKERHYLSLGGTSTLALKQYLTDHPEIRMVFLCHDNDRAGVLGMIRAQKAIRENPDWKGIAVRIDPPPASTGKDYNNYLCARRIQNTKHDRSYER